MVHLGGGWAKLQQLGSYLLCLDVLILKHLAVAVLHIWGTSGCAHAPRSCMMQHSAARPHPRAHGQAVVANPRRPGMAGTF